jgi:hypothetical protein
MCSPFKYISPHSKLRNFSSLNVSLINIGISQSRENTWMSMRCRYDLFSIYWTIRESLICLMFCGLSIWLLNIAMMRNVEVMLGKNTEPQCIEFYNFVLSRTLVKILIQSFCTSTCLPLQFLNQPVQNYYRTVMMLNPLVLSRTSC